MCLLFKNRSFFQYRKHAPSSLLSSFVSFFLKRKLPDRVRKVCLFWLHRPGSNMVSTPGGIVQDLIFLSPKHKSAKPVGSLHCPIMHCAKSARKCFTFLPAGPHVAFEKHREKSLGLFLFYPIDLERCDWSCCNNNNNKNNTFILCKVLSFYVPPTLGYRWLHPQNGHACCSIFVVFCVCWFFDPSS